MKAINLVAAELSSSTMQTKSKQIRDLLGMHQWTQIGQSHR